MSSKHDDILIDGYLRSTKNVCICTVIAIFFIIIFVLTPLKNILLASILSKTIILFILGYAVFINYTNTHKISKDTNIFSGPLDNIKTNIICSHVFSLFILLLIVTILRQFF
jgi:hypothetical protein